MHIIPSILEKNLADIEAQLTSVRGAAEVVQIDVVDGTFAANTTWPFSAPEQNEECEAIRSGEKLLPLSDDFDFQFDLMVADAMREAPRFAALGASAVIVHASSRNAREALEALQERRGGDYPLHVGVALASTVSVEALDAFSGLYDFVQVMGIARPGFQGEHFDPRALALIAALRAAYPDLTLQVDGGVGREHLADVVRAGANRVAEGSTIFSAGDPKEALRGLQTLLE